MDLVRLAYVKSNWDSGKLGMLAIAETDCEIVLFIACKCFGLAFNYLGC